MIIRIRAAGLISVLTMVVLWPALPEAAAQTPQSSGDGQNPPATCTDLSRRVELPCPTNDDSAAPAKEPGKAAPQADPPPQAEASATPKQASDNGRAKAASQSPQSPANSSPTPKQAEQDSNHVKKAPQPVQPPPADSSSTVPEATRPQRAWWRTSPFVFSYSPASLRGLPRNFAIDQRNFWTSPARIRPIDFLLLAPLAGATAGLVVKDTSIERDLPTNPTVIQRSKDFGTYGAAAFAGVTGGAFLLGKLTDNDHMAETGLLSGEAAVNTLALTFLMKSATSRQRPLEGNGQGDFRAGGNSFPSEHSAAAWSIATVIAHEYPGPLSQLLAYGAASAMTTSRVLSRQHFSSDVLVGSALGWFVGRQVYRAHANLGGDAAQYGTFLPPPREAGGRNPANMGSPYVPLDSWIYEAFDRLADFGFVQSGMAGMRPWTRMECARLLQETEDSLQDDDSAPALIKATFDALRAEFSPERAAWGGARNFEGRLESVYTRVTGISGPPLRDGFHFGQTIYNDYGRPYAEGANLITGFSARTTAGPLAVYFRGEYQHAPAGPGYPQAANEAIAVQDRVLPIQWNPFAPVSRFEPIETYVALNLGNWQTSFGKQSLWWGPSEAPLLYSNNSEPIYMLRITRTTPFTLPWLFRYMGPVRTDFFVGQLRGQQFAFSTVSGLVSPLGRQPYINGQKISFKPTPNLEIGVSKTAIFSGEFAPFTADTLFQSIFNPGNADPGTSKKPGDRRTGFDFSYRIPGLRKWLILYNDSFADDEINPIAYPRRSVMNPGIRVPQFPGLPNLEFRLEAAYSDLPNLRDVGFFYWNLGFRSGYTNKGMLIGNWVGREGRGLSSSLTYSFSPRRKIQFGYRNAWADPEFLGGGHINDFRANTDFLLRQDVSVQSWFQYEHWAFPLLSGTAKSNVTFSLQLTYTPHWKLF